MVTDSTHRSPEPAYQCNGQSTTGARFYAIACDPARQVAVEACAGAGKTWMLVSRILRALLAGATPHEILAISFTRKAAGEMRERLHQWLADFAHAPHEKLVSELVARGLADAQAQAAAPLLKSLYAKVLAAGRPVQIRTFHAWFWTLLASAPIALLQQLGLPANAELIEDDAEIVAQLWRRFYAALLAEPDARADYQALIAQHGRFNAQQALSNVLKRRVEFMLADDEGVPERSVEPAAARFPEFAAFDAPCDALTGPGCRAQLLGAAKALGTGARTFAEKGAELEQAIAQGDASGILAALFTQKNEPRKFSEKITGIERVRSVQDIALRVLAAQNQHESHQHQQRMTRLARVLLAEFAALKRERALIDMNDVERAAQHMLGDPVLGGYLHQRLDARVAHLLIDEFQDTNPLQWQALLAWLSAYAGAGGGKDGPRIFIVGDPKQSIYRFRRAEPQVFRAAQAFVRQGLGGDLLSCDHTRRNAPELIAVVNAVMGQAQQGGEYADFRPHTTESSEHGAVLELPQIARDSVAQPEASRAEPHWRDSLTEPRVLAEESLRQLECRQAAAFIAAQIAQGLAPRDVMVLARKREPLALLEAELRQLQIAATQPEKTRLADAPEVQDVVALLDALVSPGHDLSTARALRSPIFGMSDDALVQIALARREDSQAGWLDLLLNKELSKTAALEPYAVFIHKLPLWKAWIDSLPPHDALAAIYEDGDLLARFAAAAPPALRSTVLSNLRALLSTALAIDGGRYATPYALVRALKKPHGPKAPASHLPDAVQLLTVHGAKGLEAPLVLLLDAEGRIKSAESMGLLVDWPGEAPAPLRFVFLPSESRPSACCAELLAAEQAAREREELNALYVAMTRARTRLVLSSIEPAKSGSVVGWRTRLAAHCTPIDPQTFAAPASAKTATETEFYMSNVPKALVQRSWTAIEDVANQVSRPGDVAGASAASAETRIGRALHRLLEWAEPGARAFDAAQVAAVAHEFALAPEQAARAARMARTILAGDAAWAWDTAQIDWHGNEVSVVHADQLLRLDRLVRRKVSGDWWVLDYKSAHQPQSRPELIAQLRGYRAAVAAAEAGAVVRAAFVTADGALVEIE